MSEWISVKERMPPIRHDRDASDIVLFVSNNIVSFGNYMHDGPRGDYWFARESVNGAIGVRVAVTHWQPIPEKPPKPPTKDEALRLALEAFEKAEVALNASASFGDGMGAACYELKLRGKAIVPKIKEALDAPL